MTADEPPLMVNFDHLPELPGRFAEPLRKSVAGMEAVWPEAIADSDHDLIEDHGMLPMVKRLGGYLSRDEAIHDAALESLRLIDFRAVLSALREEGVEPVVLKGTALAYDVYPSPELRPRVDVDLLIDREDVDATRRGFSRLGFELRPTSGDELGYRQESFARSDAFGARHVYDVHHDITNNAVTAKALCYGELRERGHRVAALDAIAPSPVDSLLYAAIHRSVHHHDSERLIWLYDVHLIRSRMSREDHAELWRRAAEREVVAITRRTLQLSESWFGGFDEGLGAEHFLSERELNRAELSADFLERDRTGADVLVTDLAALADWSDRVRRLRQLAFPPPEYVMHAAGTRSRLKLPLLYAARAARGVRKLFKKVGR